MWVSKHLTTDRTHRGSGRARGIPGAGPQPDDVDTKGARLDHGECGRERSPAYFATEAGPAPQVFRHIMPNPRGSEGPISGLRPHGPALIQQKLAHGLPILEEAVVLLVGQYFENEDDRTDAWRGLNRIDAAESQGKLEPPGVGQRWVQATTCCKLGWNPILRYLISGERILL